MAHMKTLEMTKTFLPQSFLKYCTRHFKQPFQSLLITVSTSTRFHVVACVPECTQDEDGMQVIHCMNVLSDLVSQPPRKCLAILFLSSPALNDTLTPKPYMNSSPNPKPDYRFVKDPYKVTCCGDSDLQGDSRTLKG